MRYQKDESMTDANTDANTDAPAVMIHHATGKGMGITEAREYLKLLLLRKPAKGRWLPDAPTNEDLTGRVSGHFKIVGYMLPGRATPFWVGKCQRCGCFDVLRGNRIRQGIFSTHKNCPGSAT